MIEQATSLRQSGNWPVFLAGLALSMLVTAIAMIPAAWSVAALILIVLTMPAVLVIEPVLHLFRPTPVLPVP